ncbi:hypothetical protein ACFW35_04000 [Fictibacillus sp. NPDC058756]
MDGIEKICDENVFLCDSKSFCDDSHFLCNYADFLYDVVFL